MLSINVHSCEMELLWERGRFYATVCDLSEPLGGQVIGATVWESKAGFTRGPYHFHDGIEEWAYVVAGEPVLRDRAGERPLSPGTLVAFAAGPDGAHTFSEAGRVVMFSVGARGWGEAFTSVYLDADKIGGKPGIQFPRASALETWAEPHVATVTQRLSGPCPQVDLKSLSGERSNLRGLLHTQTWAPTVCDLLPGEADSAYRYDWCRESWVLVLTGTPTLRHAEGQDVMAPGDMVCLLEGEAGAHQFLNQADAPARLLVCSAPVSGLSATVYPDDDTYVLRVPGQSGYRFRLADQLGDYWDGEPGAGPG
jgi:uncharacterized cupin superfamily protein